MEHFEITLSRQNSIVDNFPSCSTNPPCKKSSLTDNADATTKRDALKSSTHSLPFVFLAQILAGFLLLGTTMMIVNFQQMRQLRYRPEPTITESQTRSCANTCRIEVVESIPQNLTFGDEPLLMSTFEAWRRLIKGAKHSLSIAAYKSSLRGKHVFGSTAQEFSEQGELIYEELENAGLHRKVAIRMVENGPSKDKGDNEDGKSLQRLGALNRRELNLQKIFGTGTMHSKFIIADGKDFYLGSANLDWRSLNQKMEQGVFVSNCPCLARDLSSIFETYWKLANAKSAVEIQSLVQKNQYEVQFNAQRPLRLDVNGVTTDMYLAASPRYMNHKGTTWDLDSIVHSLNSAKRFAYIHVMDYFPMFLYGKQKRFWPILDNAIRAAIVRGVHIKMVAAALHYPELGIRFLRSLESITGTSGSISIKIFKVPSSENVQSVIRRDRRTHKKFLVTDDIVIIGTSNWSGDYFDDKGTGAAIVIRQNSSSSLITKMKRVFERDWNSDYVHHLDDYFNECILPKKMVTNGTSNVADFCEAQKDLSLLVNMPRI